MRVIIVGGSLTGLMHGIILKRLGHSVCILEQNTQSVRGDLAAGITAHPQVEEFFRLHDHIQEPWSVYSPGIRFLSKSCAVKRSLNRPFQMTSWAVLYYRLRANYDGFASDFCPQPPKPTEGDGIVIYDVGKRATNLTLSGSTVTVYFDNLLTNEQGSVQGDLVILADGASSSLNSVLFPAIQRTYAGYVAFRGTIPEADVSEEAKKVFDPYLSYFTFKNGYILLYIIPGTDGSLEPDSRRYNWVWYHQVSAASPEFAEIMTDTSGRLHRNTLPVGGMKAAVWQTYVALAQERMCAPFAELVAGTSQPFVTAVSEAMCPRATALGGRVLIVGEALNLMRPHMALSTAQSAVHALALERALRQGGTSVPRQWERDVLHYARVSRLKTNAFGTFFLYGYIVAVGWAIKLCAVLLSDLWPLSLLWIPEAKKSRSMKERFEKKDQGEAGTGTDREK